MNTPECIFVFESWECMVRCINEAIEESEWDDLSASMHSGIMAIEVNGIPRVIDGAIH